jgi:hypothetical protein
VRGGKGAVATSPQSVTHLPAPAPADERDRIIDLAETLPDRISAAMSYAFEHHQAEMAALIESALERAAAVASTPPTSRSVRLRSAWRSIVEG